MSQEVHRQGQRLRPNLSGAGIQLKQHRKVALKERLKYQQRRIGISV